MKLKLHITLLLAAVAALASSCDNNDYVEPIIAPSVLVEYIPTANASEISLVLNPSRSVASYKYAVTLSDDAEAFLKGELDDIRTAEGPQKAEVVFTGLVAPQIYNVYAVGYAEDGTAGPLASMKIKTRGPLPEITAEPSFILERSAAVIISGHTNYYKYVFALARPMDKEAFEKGVLDGITVKEEMRTYTATYFDLDMDSEYVFYLIAYDRLSDQPTETFEIPIHTAAKGTVPAVDLAVEHIDLFNGDYRITPNPLCKKFAVAGTLYGEFDEAFENETYKGSVLDLIHSWDKSNNANYVVQGYMPIFYQFTTASLMLGDYDAFNYPVELFVLVYGDDTDTPAGVQKFVVETPAYDDNAGEAEATVIVSDIHDYGAMYEFVVNEHTMGLVYETVDEEWYEALLRSSSYYEGYMEDLIYENGYWNYVHGISRTSFPEATAQPGRSYRVFYMAMNHNGPFGGLSKMKSFSYTTTGKDE